MSKIFNILRLKFSNITCYGENNIIDFRKNTNNNIIEMISPGGYGKSSIAFAILFALFGDKVGQNIHVLREYFDEPDRFTPKNFINGRGKSCLGRQPETGLSPCRGDFKCSIFIESENKKYTIYRTGTADYQDVRVIMYRFDDGKLVKVCDSNDDSSEKIDARIENIVGTYSDFLITSSHLSLHGIYTNFVDLKSKHRYQYLHNTLGIFKVEDCLKSVQSCVNEFIYPELNMRVYFVLDTNRVNSKRVKLMVSHSTDPKKLSIDICSGSEKEMISIAIKYAFYKIFPIVKPNLFILDSGYDYGLNTKLNPKFEAIFKKINSDGINLMIMNANRNIRMEDTYVVKIDYNKEDAVASINK